MTQRRIWPSGWRGVALIVVGIYIGATMITPAVAHVAGWTHNWKNHIKPKTDARYYTKAQSNSRFLPSGTMPAGTTVRGGFSQNAPSGSFAFASYNFAGKFAGNLESHYVSIGGTPPAECSGSAAAPTAAAGHLCLYEETATNVNGNCIYDPETFNCTGANEFGFGLAIYPSNASAQFYVSGTWAATGGAGPTALSTRAASADRAG